ncbi:MAG: K(+)-transporting ATPase subunit C [Bacteroidia bacterium]
MKTHIFPAIKLTLLLLVLLCGVYTLVVLGIAKAVPGSGKGEVIEQNGKKYYANIGQQFTEDRYFYSRPSAVDYNAAGSGASNKGPSNEEYLATVSTRIDTFLLHNLGIKKSEIPVDLVTASGSGLDPDISVAAAKVQVKRIATLRQLSPEVVLKVIDQQTEKPFLGVFGPEKINVLKLNIALNGLKK